MDEVGEVQPRRWNRNLLSCPLQVNGPTILLVSVTTQELISTTTTTTTTSTTTTSTNQNNQTNTPPSPGNTNPPAPPTTPGPTTAPPPGRSSCLGFMSRFRVYGSNPTPTQASLAQILKILRQVWHKCTQLLDRSWKKCRRHVVLRVCCLCVCVCVCRGSTVPVAANIDIESILICKEGMPAMR